MSHEPSEDQLRAAYQAIRQPGWEEFDQLKRAACHWSLVRLRASLLASGKRVEPAPDVHTAAAPPPHWGTLRVSRQQPVFDRKRAAAGEREDD